MPYSSLLSPSYHTPFQLHAASSGYTKPHAKLSQSNLLSCYIQIILRFLGCPSKSQVFKSCFSTKWYVILHFFETVLVQTTTSHLTTCSQNQPYNIYQHCFPLYLARFTHAYFYIQLSLQSTLKAFSLPQAFSQFSLRQWPSEQGSVIVRTYTIPGFPKHGQGIKALTMTDPLLPRLKKLVFCW